jgi:hypothetical protein
VIHKQGIKPVPKQHLLRRQNGVYYYRRRVPVELVDKIGRTIVQVSLRTKSPKEANRRCTLYDLQWDGRFAAAEPISAVEEGECLGMGPTPPTPSLPEGELVQLVRDYVERQDRRAQKRYAASPPSTGTEQTNMRIEAEYEAQTLHAPDNPQAQEWIYRAGQDLLKPAGKSFEDPDIPGELLAELVRRGLLELSRRRQARLADNHSRTFFDQLFDSCRPPTVTFGKLAEQCFRLAEEEAAINTLGQKGLDRERAKLALIREIVGDDTPIETVDYDTCLRVRSILAQLPANRTKLYGDLPLDQAIERAAKEGRPRLSPVTQQGYLGALRYVLDLAAKKAADYRQSR